MRPGNVNEGHLIKIFLNSYSRNLFVIIPILSLAQIPGLFISTDLFRLTILVLTIMVLVFLHGSYLRINKIGQLLPVLLIAIYFLNQLVLKNDLTTFLLGRFNRYGGIISLICFTVLFILASNKSRAIEGELIQALNITYIIMMTYGLLEVSGLLNKFQALYNGKRILDQQSYLTLSLGNPNMASAFLALVISMHLGLILFKSQKNYLIQIPILLTNLFLLSQTKSMQGWLILILCASFYAFIIYRRNLSIFTRRLNILASFALLILVMVLSFNISRIIDLIIVGGHVNERLNYWKLSIKIWQDFKITGVGVDNLGEYSTFYRDEKLFRQEGVWTVPDRSHNVILDHLVNGGIFAGLLWLIFVTVISVIAIRLLAGDSKTNISTHQIIVITIWFGYLLQSILSVDHIFLTMIGYCCAGVILGSNSISGRVKFFKKLNLVFVTVPVLSIFLLFNFNQLRLDYLINKFLAFSKVENIEPIYNSKYIDQQLLLDVVVKISENKQFGVAEQLSDKLIRINPYAHQAFYAKSVWYESEGEIIRAKSEMLEAHRLDKFNPVYTLALGIYEFKLSNYTEANFWLDKTIKLYPNQQGIEILQKLLVDKLN